MAHLEFRGKMPKIAKITIFPKISPRYISVSHKRLRIDLWQVSNVFDTKKIFQVPKSKTDEISLPFSGGGPNMAHLEFREKMPKMANITIFPKIYPRYVSVNHKRLRIDLWEV